MKRIIEGLGIATMIMGLGIGGSVAADVQAAKKHLEEALAGAEIIAHPANLILPYCPDAMVTRCQALHQARRKSYERILATERSVATIIPLPSFMHSMSCFFLPWIKRPPKK